MPQIIYCRLTVPKWKLFVKLYLRNPTGDESGPWCYTTDPDVIWEPCDINMTLYCEGNYSIRNFGMLTVLEQLKRIK